MAQQQFDPVEAERLAVAAAAGDGHAFMELVNAVWPELMSLLASSRRLGPLARSEDDCREIGVGLVEKLARHDYRALGQYVEWRGRHPDKSFHDWLRIVAANAVRDYVRAQRRSRPPPADEPSPLRLLNEFAATLPLDELGSRPQVTAAQTARQLLEFAEEGLGAEQYRALTDWLKGGNYEEIGEKLSLSDPDEARKMVRAAVASLRRRFA